MIELKEHTCKLLARKTKAGNLKVEAYNANRYVATSEQVFISKKNAEMLRDYLNEQYPVENWISVDDRQPYDDCQCLGYYDDGMFGKKVEMMNYHSGRCEWKTYHDYYRTPTHWRPLPSPPRGD